MSGKIWKKLLAAGCAMSLLATAPGMTVLADQFQEDEVIVIEAEEPEQEIKPAEATEVSFDGEVVGTGEFVVGNGVTATYDEETGAVEFISQDGELWRDWVDKLGVGRDEIESIKVASGILYLPVNSNGEVDVYDSDDDYTIRYYYLFGGLENLTNLDLSSVDTSNVTDMSGIFSDCSSLRSLDFSNFNTSNVTDMSSMFSGCSSLTELDLSSFDTSKVMDISNMFSGCDNLTELDLSDFDTSKVTNMYGMFSSCSCLNKLDLSGFDTSKVTDMGSMFSGIRNLTKLDLSSFDTSNVTNMGNMFCGFTSRVNLDLSGFDTLNVTDTQSMFESCFYLTDLDLSSFNTLNVTDMSNMFYECKNLTELDLSSFKTSNVTDMRWMFNGCSSLTNLDLSSFDMSKVTNMAGMFSDCSSLTNLNLSSFKTMNVTDMTSLFSNCSNLTNLDLSNFDTSMVTQMNWMFDGCGNLSNLDLSGFDMTNAWFYDYENLFYGCDMLSTLKTPKKNTTPVELPFFMYDDAGNEYKELPTLSESIVLTRNKPTTKKDIIDCVITLSALNYTYDGKAKVPTVTVKNGSTALISGTDYTVNYADNTNAGTATVKVTGAGNYKGEKSVTFTISKADAKLAFADSALTKKTTDAAFTNTLTKTTDGSVTFKSSNTKVATVNSTSGLVTIKGAGTATITATASEGKNYKAGSASYTLTVKAPAPTATATPTPKPTATPTPKPTVSGFSDVQDPKHAYYKAIYWAADAGITKGYPDGTFGINRPCTRGEMMMFLWRYAGKPASKNVSTSPFKDVPKTHTFYNAILWGSQKGITKGYSDGTFGVNRNVSRGECMMFLWRLRGKPAPKAVAKSPFSDVPKTHVFYNAILWGAQKKITTGYTSGAKKGTFGINENCTRGQIVTFLYRAK